jgi:hypothetical protein
MLTSFGDASKRTAAVQPTPHESTTTTTTTTATTSATTTATTTSTRQHHQSLDNWQVVQNPSIFINTASNNSQLTETGNNEENQQQATDTNQTIPASSLLNKRSREDDQSDDANNKKQRQTDENLNDNQLIESSINPQVATIEPYIIPSNEQQEAECIIIADEGQNEDNYRFEPDQEQEEILIDESNSEDSDNDASSDVINITDRNPEEYDSNEDNEGTVHESDTQPISSQDDDQNNSQSSDTNLHLEIHPDDDHIDDNEGQKQEIEDIIGESTSNDADELLNIENPSQDEIEGELANEEQEVEEEPESNKMKHFFKKTNYY